MQLNQDQVNELAAKADRLQGLLDSVKSQITTPTWGYHPSEPARVFELKPGEALPQGWRDRPFAPDEHPADHAAADSMKATGRGR